jgi:hypothetical protein
MVVQDDHSVGRRGVTLDSGGFFANHEAGCLVHSGRAPRRGTNNYFVAETYPDC